MHQLLAEDKTLTAAEAVERYVRPGSVIGLGGQNINRCPMALVHQVIRQAPGELTVVGCNLSLPLDMLVAAGLVRRTEQGSGNLEKYGTLFTWRRAAESGAIEIADYSHLTMASRFLAGSLGLPFMPTRSLLGTSVLEGLLAAGDARLVSNPWGDEPVVLLRAMTPDVALIHANRADVEGNVVIDGVTSHEVDMVKAAKATIVTVEELVPAGELGADPERVTISSAFVSAVVHEPFGAFPTSVYQRYDYYEPEIVAYQAMARAGVETDAYLNRAVRWQHSFGAYLNSVDPDGAIRERLTAQMRSLM